MNLRRRKNKVVIPIRNTTIDELNDPQYESEPKHTQLQIWSFLCLITIMISGLFCCVTV